MSPIFSSNSEEKALELPEYIVKMFPRYYSTCIQLNQVSIEFKVHTIILNYVLPLTCLISSICVEQINSIFVVKGLINIFVRDNTYMWLKFDLAHIHQIEKSQRNVSSSLIVASIIKNT